MKFRQFLLAAMVIFTPLPASAQGNDYMPGAAPSRTIDATTTTNGQLTPFSRGHKKHKAPSARALAKYDHNGDGKLDANERSEMKAAREKHKQMMNDPAHQARKQKLIQRFDTNGDGALDDNEKAAMRAFREQRKQKKLSRQ